MSKGYSEKTGHNEKIGSRISAGSRVRSGKSEEFGNTPNQEWDHESQLSYLLKTQLKSLAEDLGLSTSGTKATLKRRIAKELSHPSSDNPSQTNRIKKEKDLKQKLDSMSFKELREVKRTLGIKTNANTKPALKRVLKAQIAKYDELEWEKESQLQNPNHETSDVFLAHESGTLPTHQNLVQEDFTVIYRIAPKKTRSSQNQRQQEAILEQYKEENLFPLFYPSNAKDLVDLNELRQSIKEYKIIAEKPEYITSENKDETVTTKGNQVQTRFFDDQLYGVFFQRASKATKENPAPTLFKVADNGEIRVDDDDAGHFIAWFTNAYAMGEPNLANVRFNNQGELHAVDVKKAMRFHAKSILDSAGFQQNKALTDAIMDNLGKKALVYRDQGKNRQLNVSEQKLQMVNFVYSDKVKLKIDLVDQPIDIVFDYRLEDLPDNQKPVLEFESYQQGKAQRLNSDMLLRAAVKKLNLEPDGAQALIETLHHQEWITYPRASVEKAEEVPIKIQEDKNVRDFTGTFQERQILELVEASEQAYNEDRNFVQNGAWVLKSEDGTEITRSPRQIIFAGDKERYSSDEFDIRIAPRGITPEELTGKLITNDIGTPATRTSLLQELKQAGVITTRKDRYIIDNRGLYFIAAYKNLKRELTIDGDFNNVKNLTRKLKSIDISKKTEKEVLAEFAEIGNQYRIIDRKKLAKNIKNEVNGIIEKEQDLSELEAY